MELNLERKYKKANYTIGKLSVNGYYFCDTIEDTDRGLRQDMSEFEIKSRKIKDKTAIPLGKYTITLNVVSPKFSQKAYYKKLCNGRVPRLLKVPGFDGILIHIGKNADSSSGCIIVGKNTIVGQVTNSQMYFEQLYARLEQANKNKEQITININ